MALKLVLKIISISFIIVVISSCSFVNFKEVSGLADQAFANKDFAKFNEHYNKLQGADKTEFATYTNKIKSDEIFNVQAYNSSKKVDEGLELLAKISTEVPPLTEFVKTKLDVLASNKKYYDGMRQATTDTNSLVSSLDEPLNSAYYTVILINGFDTLNKLIKDMKSSSSRANSIIIALENLKVPNEYTNQHNSFSESLKKLKKSLDDKSTFMEGNNASIISSRELSMKGNIFGLETMNKLNADMNRLGSEIKSANKDLKERSVALESLFK